MAKKKEPWDLTIDDLPKAFKEYPELAKQTALIFYRTALDNGFNKSEAEALIDDIMISEEAEAKKEGSKNENEG